MYRVKEIFPTLQGEGIYTGQPAVFLRFANCNLWSGKEEDRARDASRNGAACPLWCDTDFQNGTRMSAGEVADAVAEHWQEGMRLVVTGGEPSLQWDGMLAAALAHHEITSVSMMSVSTPCPMCV